MLKFKDLFKIDITSTGGKKLANKIFNKYGFPKNERNKVSKEIFNKCSNDNDEPGYMKVKTITVKIINEYNPNDAERVILPILLSSEPPYWEDFVKYEAWTKDLNINFKKPDTYITCTFYGSSGYLLLNDTKVSADDEMIAGAEYVMKYSE